MLEILVVYWLSKKNAESASNTGNSKIFAVVLTILLWFGMEFLGAFIGSMFTEGAMIYVVALVSAIIGGFLSRVIVNSMKPKETA